ncbi:MAG: ATP-binding protein [bacterium]
MNLFASLGILIGITSFIFGLFVFLKNKNNKINILWFLFTIQVAIWGFGGAKIGITKDIKSAFLYWKVAHIGIIMMPVFFLHFVFTFLKIKKPKITIATYIISFIFLFCNLFTDKFISNMRYVFDSFYYDSPPGLIYIPFVIFFGLVIIYAHYELYNAHKKAKGTKKRQIQYFFLATFIGFSGGSISFLPVFKIDVYPFLNLAIALYPIIMTYAIIKYHLLDIKIAFNRAGIILFVYIFVLGIPFLILYYTKSGLISTSLAVVLATPGPLIYRYFQEKAENILLARQRLYQKALLKAGKAMVREHDLDKLLKFITDIIKLKVGIEFAGFFLKYKNDKNYTLKKIRGYKDFPKNLAFSVKHPLIKLLKEKKTSLHYEDIEHILNSSLDKHIHLVVPAFIDNELLGFLILGEKKDHTFYTEEDIDVFEILSREAALAIDHCIFMVKFSKDQERVFRAEKLASIGGMADGVAHQMKNRLNFFSVVTGGLKFETSTFWEKHPQLIEENYELKKYFEYLSETGDSLINNVKKTNAILEGILNFARTEEKEAYFSWFSLQELINTSLGLLLVKHRIREFPLEMEVDPSDLIYGVKSQLLECVYNILDNCYEAIKEKMDFPIMDEEKVNFEPLIKLSLSKNKKISTIEISDNGIGIKDENKQKIFAPFFTTKSSQKSGTGIGLYVVKRIIEENHKGKISFQSKFMIGTRFIIEIPENTQKNKKRVFQNASLATLKRP